MKLLFFVLLLISSDLFALGGVDTVSSSVGYTSSLSSTLYPTIVGACADPAVVANIASSFPSSRGWYGDRTSTPSGLACYANECALGYCSSFTIATLTYISGCPVGSSSVGGVCTCGSGLGSVDGASCVPVCEDSGGLANLWSSAGNFSFTKTLFNGSSIMGSSVSTCFLPAAVNPLSPPANTPLCQTNSTLIFYLFGVSLTHNVISRAVGICGSTPVASAPLDVVLAPSVSGSPPVAFTPLPTSTCGSGVTVTNADGSGGCFPASVANPSTPSLQQQLYPNGVPPVISVPGGTLSTPSSSGSPGIVGSSPSSNPFASNGGTNANGTPSVNNNYTQISGAGVAAASAVAASGGSASAVGLANTLGQAIAASIPTDYARTGEAQMAANSTNAVLKNTNNLLGQIASSVVASSGIAPSDSDLAPASSVPVGDSALADIKSWVLPSHTSTCPSLTADFSTVCYGGHCLGSYSMDSVYCPMFATASGYMSVAMVVVWSIVALFVVLGA